MSIERGEIVRKWAEQKYGVEEVAGVSFEIENDPDWSDLTPGMGDCLLIKLYGDRDQVLKEVREEDTAGIVVEVCRYIEGLSEPKL